MKREILFRAKSIYSEKWIESMTISGGTVKLKRADIFIEVEENKWKNVIPETVGQFTGLTDKNGINIFEGDIVEVCGCGIASVIFNTSMASFMVLTKSKYNDGTNIHVGFEETEQDEIEVIGNIFDTPELLK